MRTQNTKKDKILLV